MSASAIACTNPCFANLKVISLTNFFLINSNDSERTGALSDGLHWTIWHNSNGGWYMGNFKTQSMEDAITVLSKYLFQIFLC